MLVIVPSGWTVVDVSAAPTERTAIILEARNLNKSFARSAAADINAH
jgi:hypothetical protein